MLSLSRTRVIILLVILAAFVFSIAILHAVYPSLWHDVLGTGPYIISHV